MGQGITTFSQHFATQMSPHYPQLEPIYYESRAKKNKIEGTPILKLAMVKR